MNAEELISCIFVKHTLWDQKDPQHHNRCVLDKLWDTVAIEMKSTRGIVRCKWKTLRDTYRKVLSKVPAKRSGDGTSQLIKPSWQYFHTLSFMKDQFISTARSSGGNLSDIAREDNILQEVTVDSEVAETNEQEATDSVSDTQTFLDAEIIPPTSNTPALAPTPTYTKKGMKRKQQNDNDISTALVRIEESKLKILQNQQTKTTDEDSSFFDSLLPHVRTLPPGKKMLLRMKIEELVYRFVYGNECQNIANVSHVRETTTPIETFPRSHDYNSQFTNLQTVTQDYSNPTSIASYISTFSDESFH